MDFLCYGYLKEQNPHNREINDSVTSCEPRSSIFYSNGEIRMTAKLPARLYFGCAGWSYKEWVGPLYDGEKSMLQQYASVFDTVELNSSFYRAPSEGTILGLAKYTKRGFMFSAKINQKYTHDLALKLDEASVSELENFVQLFDPLLTQDRLGCFLVQLPPSLKRNDQLLEDFLAALPHRYNYVVEFRNKSWMDETTWRILAKYQAAYCIVDEPLLPPEIHVTSEIGYIRWHGHGERPWYDYRYTQGQLQEWIPKIRSRTTEHEENIRHIQQPFPWICSRELPSNHADAWNRKSCSTEDNEARTESH